MVALESCWVFMDAGVAPLQAHRKELEAQVRHLQSLQPLETPPTKPPFLFSWRWVREPGWGGVEPSLHGWAGTCSCGESFPLLFSGGLCI